MPGFCFRALAIAGAGRKAILFSRLTRKLVLAHIVLLVLLELAMSRASFGQELSASNVPCAGPQMMYKKLQDLAAETSAAHYGLAQKRVVVTSKALLFNLEAAPYSFFTSTPDRITVPLELLVRIAVLRRDLGQLKQTFPTGPLERLMSIARRMVDAACNSTTDNDWQKARHGYESDAQNALADIGAALENYAEAAGLAVVKERGPADGFLITIRRNPPDARLRIMPKFDFALCELDRSRIEICLNKKWRTPANTERLVGKYQWQLLSNDKSKDGTFEADMDKTIQLP